MPIFFRFLGLELVLILLLTLALLLLLLLALLILALVLVAVLLLLLVHRQVFILIMKTHGSFLLSRFDVGLVFARKTPLCLAMLSVNGEKRATVAGAASNRIWEKAVFLNLRFKIRQVNPIPPGKDLRTLDRVYDFVLQDTAVFFYHAGRAVVIVVAGD